MVTSSEHDFWSFWPDVARATRDGMSDGLPYWLALAPVREMSSTQLRVEAARVVRNLLPWPDDQ